MSTKLNKASVLTGILAVLSAAVPAWASINLEFRTTSPWVVGDTVEVGLYAVSDDDSYVQSFSAIRAVFSWDPTYLDLIGVDQTGAVDLLSSGFPADDAWGLNEVVPPQDGDGLYQGLAMFGQPVEATVAGVLVTTFQFEALSPTPATPLDILVEGGSPPITTLITDGVVPGLDVTGALVGASVTIVPEPAAMALLLGGVLVLLGRR